VSARVNHDAGSTRRGIWLATLLWLAVFLLPAQLSATSQSDRPTGRQVLTAGWVLRPDGTLGKNLAVVLGGGRIERVVPVGRVRREDARDFGPQAVIAPGLVDLFSSLGAARALRETAELVDPDASPLWALDPLHPDFRLALRAGVTAAVVAPEPVNLVSGVCVTVRTHTGGASLDVLRDNGPLVFAFGEGVWRPERAPTSRAGMVHEFGKLVAEARKGLGPERVRAALAGQLDAVVVCPSAVDVTAVRGVLGGRFRRFGLVHSQDIVELVDLLKQMRRPVVVGPYGFSSSRRELLGAAALADAGVEVAFCGGLPELPAAGLRITAALAVRQGMNPAAARRAMTINPARVGGVASRVGAVAAAKEADLVVFSRDPLRLDARVLEVYVRGKRVFAAQAAAAGPEGGAP